MAGAMAKPRRWAAISASANAEADYNTVFDDPNKAHSSVYICPPIDDGKETDSVEWSECDWGRSCTCQKPASEPYQHPWIVSRAGYQKYVTQYLHAGLRDPAAYQMHTFNDHYGYGQLEMMQNLLLDFVEAEKFGEQWAIVEGTVLWLLDEDSMELLGIGTCQDLVGLFNLIGRMFVCMLARLDRRGLSDKVPTLGAVMSLYIELYDRLHRTKNILKKEEKTPGAFEYDVTRLDSYVLAYAQKHSIALPYHGSSGAWREEYKDESLPTPTMNRNDPWGFVTAFNRYRNRYSKGMASVYCGFRGIGGDALDITTWDSEKRSAKSVSKKDPLTKKEINAIKQGLVLYDKSRIYRREGIAR